MKKITAAAAAAVLILIGLCGCAAQTSSEEIASVSSATSESTTTVTDTAESTASETEKESESMTDTTQTSAETTSAAEALPSMTLIGHASVKIKTTDGRVIYIDPAYRGDYSETADIILVTHGHDDHNKILQCKSDDETRTINYKDSLIDGEYQSFDFDGIKIEAVPAENSNHPRSSCVGYILSFDGISLYHAGDTSYVEEMDSLAERKLDYALFPIDGKYNMDAAEASDCAEKVGAAHSIPIHIKGVSDQYDADKAAAFSPSGAMQLAYGETVRLSAE